MSPETIRILVAATLFLQGVAYARALGALIAQRLGTLPASWLPVRSWLFPSLSDRSAATVAAIFWFLSTVGFITAALSFWGFLVPPDIWSPLAVAAAIISILGIALFSGIWPGAPSRKLAILDTLIALAVDIAVLITQLWLHWLPS